MKAVQPYLSVVITNYNEEQNLLTGVLNQIVAYLQDQSYTFELVLVDDGSRDNTLSLLHEFAKGKKNVRVIANSHMGKAAGIISGALAATGKIVLFTDTDQSTPISEFSKFIPYYSENYSVVFGSRSKRAGAPLFRQVLAFGMVFFRTLILNLPYRDTQCGFKSFSSVAAQRIFTTLKTVHPLKTIDYPTTNPGFDLEIFYLARKFGFKTKEVPVSWYYRESKRVTFFKDAVNGIKELLLVRWRSLSNAYKI
jgi:dolichyl-phosphate beta-glucosyltransferase